MFLKSERKWYGLDTYILFVIPILVFLIGAYIIHEKYTIDEPTVEFTKPTQFVEKYPSDYMLDNHLILLSNQTIGVREQESKTYEEIVLPSIIEKYRVKAKQVERVEVWADIQDKADTTVFIYRLNIGGKSDLSVFIRINPYGTPIEMYVTKW